jgi:biotin carboxyl carrier protein
MKIEDIPALARLMQSREIGLVEVEDADGRLRLIRATPPEQAAPQAEALCSPADGTFLRRHPARKTPGLVLGNETRAGDIVAFLQRGDMLLPLAAPCDGTVSRILAGERSRVVEGTPLFEVAPPTIIEDRS